MDTITYAEEVAIAVRIGELEQELLQMLKKIPPAVAALKQRGKHAERTKAGGVRRLATAVKAVAEAAKNSSDKPLQKQSRKAMEMWQEAEVLRWKLAMSAQRIARGEAKKLRNSSLEFPDLVQEGFIGLLRAAQRFDPTRGIRFSTYARWWVRAQMTRSIDNARFIRLPSGAVEQMGNLHKLQKRYARQRLNPSLADLAEEAQMSLERAKLLLEQGSSSTVISLDTNTNDERPFSNILPADTAAPDEAAMLRVAIARMMAARGKVLDARERLVLNRHYGLEGHAPETLEEIGLHHLGVHREWVRLIEKGALKKLRDELEGMEPTGMAA